MKSSTTTTDARYIKLAINTASGKADESLLVGNALLDLSRLIEGSLRRFLQDVISNYGQLKELEPADPAEIEATKIHLKSILESDIGQTWGYLKSTAFLSVTRYKTSDVLADQTLKSMNMLFDFRNVWAHGLDFTLAESDGGVDYEKCKPRKFIQYIHQDYGNGSLYTPPQTRHAIRSHVNYTIQMNNFLTVKVLLHFYKEGVNFLQEINSHFLEFETDETLLIALDGMAYHLTHDMDI